MSKTIKRMAEPKKKDKVIKYTQRQQKLVKEISDNIGIKGFTKTMQQMMIDAGYSASMAKQQTLALSGIKDEVEPIVGQLIIERDRAIERLKDKISDAKYRDLTDGVDKLTKNIQLLSNKHTEKSKIELDDNQLNQLISSRGRTPNS